MIESLLSLLVVTVFGCIGSSMELTVFHLKFDKGRYKGEAPGVRLMPVILGLGS